MRDRKIKILACAVMAEELRPLVPPDTVFEKMDFGLHSTPDKLNKALQQKIDESGEFDYIVLGFGLCGMATVGLHSDTSTIVVPKADDCISVLLGSREAYIEQQLNHPGSYFLSKGWIDGYGDQQVDEISPSADILEKLVEKYGVEKARRIYGVYQDKAPLQNYKRLIFIATSDDEGLQKYKEKARERAEKLGLDFEERRGTDSFLKKIAGDNWDNSFVIVPPGRAVSFDDFKSS